MKSAVCATILTAAAVFQTTAVSAADPAEAERIDRGRYVVTIAGCNDCHTAGYAEAGGEVPESEWLKGDSLGWQGPWGTTYATNLRLRLADRNHGT